MAKINLTVNNDNRIKYQLPEVMKAISLSPLEQEARSRHLKSQAETFNEMLDEQALKAVSENPGVIRSGHYTRSIATVYGTAEIQMPKLKGMKFETELVHKNRLLDPDVARQVLYDYLSGHSLRKISDNLTARGLTGVSPSSLCRLTKETTDLIDSFNNRSFQEAYPIIFLDALYVSIGSGDKAVLTAVGISESGYLEFLGQEVYESENYTSYVEFLTHLKDKGLHGVCIIMSDGLRGLDKAAPVCFPGATNGSCLLHAEEGLAKKVGKKHRKQLLSDLKSLFDHALTDPEELIDQAVAFVEANEEAFPKMIEAFKNNFGSLRATLTTEEQRAVSIRTSSIIEGTNSYNRREIRIRRHYANEKSYLRISGLHLLALHIKWQDQPYLDPDDLKKLMDFYSCQTSSALNVSEAILSEAGTASAEEFKDTNILYLSANFRDVQIGPLTVSAGVLMAAGVLSDGRRVPLLSVPLLSADTKAQQAFIKDLALKCGPDLQLVVNSIDLPGFNESLRKLFPEILVQKDRDLLMDCLLLRLPEKQRKFVRPHLKKLFEAPTRSEALRTLSWIKGGYLSGWPEASEILQSWEDESGLEFTFFEGICPKKITTARGLFSSITNKVVQCEKEETDWREPHLDITVYYCIISESLRDLRSQWSNSKYLSKEGILALKEGKINSLDRKIT